MRTVALALLIAAAAACRSPEPPRAEARATTDGWSVPALVDDADAPWDPRLLRMFPEAHLGAERVCDLSFVGNLQTLEARHAGRYPEPVNQRAAVRCRAAQGEGWADLVFTKDTVGLAPYARVGERIRVRAVALSGFEDMPVLAFVAHIGVAPPAPPPRWVWTPVPAADPLDGRPGRGLCAVTYVGSIEPAQAPVFPEGSAQRAVVACRHPLGEDLVALVFPEPKQLSALRVRRGEVVPVEVTDRRTDGGLSVATYLGP